MNLEEAKANIGKEVVLDKSTKPYTWMDDDGVTHIHNDESNTDKMAGILNIISAEDANITVEGNNRFQECYLPKHIKLKEQPMQNYKIKVTPENSPEIQEMFFELGYRWESCGKVVKYVDMAYLFIYTTYKIITYAGREDSFNKSTNQEITLPQLRDMVVLKRNIVEDATHKDNDGNLYYELCDLELYMYSSSNTWVKCGEGEIIYGLKRIDVITWEEALQHFLAGRDVEMLDSHNQWEDMKEFYLHDIATNGNQFRLKPKTIYIESGHYTKEQFDNLLEKFHD